MRVESISLAGRLSTALERKGSAGEGIEVDQQALRDSWRVSLSELGKARSAAAQKNRDIDQSSLPGVIKDLLKRIRELKEQIESKQAELAAVISDQGLTPEIRRSKSEALQGELASLQGALTVTNATLIKAMQE